MRPLNGGVIRNTACSGLVRFISTAETTSSTVTAIERTAVGSDDIIARIRLLDPKKLRPDGTTAADRGDFWEPILF
jgi:hypothetical protein